MCAELAIVSLVGERMITTSLHQTSIGDSHDLICIGQVCSYTCLQIQTLQIIQVVPRENTLDFIIAPIIKTIIDCSQLRKLLHSYTLFSMRVQSVFKISFGRSHLDRGVLRPTNCNGHCCLVARESSHLSTMIKPLTSQEKQGMIGELCFVDRTESSMGLKQQTSWQAVEIQNIYIQRN